MINEINEMISFIQSQKRFEKKVSLQRMKKLCEIYGSPEIGLNYIHVGGTNGKGSVVSYLKNILIDSGYNVGSYVSPYVICFNERISYNEKYITDEEILEFGNLIISKYDLLDSLEINHPSFFEFMTLMAFLYFKSKKDIDYVVLEVGLGGLLDCTNIIDPLLSVITNVSYDHMNVLGNTLDEIAINKLGIVKQDKCLVTISNPEINHLFFEKCGETNSKLIMVNKEDIKNICFKNLLMEFDYKNYHLESKMIGYHQTENICIALEAIEELMRIRETKITISNILNGIKNTFWPGRFQIICQKPLVVVDGAHNIDGIRRLCETVKIVAKNKKVTIIFAVSKDKEKENMIHQLEGIADEIIFSSFNYKRSDDPELLLDLSNTINKQIISDLDEYIKKIKSDDNDEAYIFCGSLYFVSELLPKFNKIW